MHALARTGADVTKRKLPEYPRPWLANMQLPRPPPTQTEPVVVNKKVGEYDRPWLDRPRVKGAPGCPPVKHTVTVPIDAERRAQVCPHLAFTGSRRQHSSHTTGKQAVPCLIC